MKSFKLSLRLWIAATSVFSFFGGWILFAHANKPVDPVPAQPVTAEVAPLPTLEPLPALNDPISTLQPLPAQPLPLVRAPRLRTGAS